MAFDQKTRNLLQRTVSACRRILDEEFASQRREIFGINDDGTAAPLELLVHLPDEDMQTARLLRDRLDHLVAGLTAHGKKEADARKESVGRLTRELAFTVLNRLAALRMAEEREIVLECVRHGLQSEGFLLFQQSAGGAFGDTYHSYRAYLFVLFDELAIDLGGLFSRWDPAGLLFPGPEALEAVLHELNGSGSAAARENLTPDEFNAIWSEDETIGWIYQYYNDPAERKKMRDESAAPRNSREMAVRNQFFTPRYVVEFLTDNSLGRLWYEMTKGRTSLKDRCRYLIRRPCEFFLPDPDRCALPDTYQGRREMLTFWKTGNVFDLPENPDVGVVMDWLNRLRQDGFEPELAILGTDHQTVMDRWFMPVEQANPPAELPDLHPVILMHCLWRIGVQIERTGYDDQRRPVSEDPWASHFWLALRQQLLHPPEGLSQEDTLKRPVFVPHRPIKEPHEIRIIDPACGSMHFGLYAFDLLEVIYAEAYAAHADYGTADLRSNYSPEFIADFAADPASFLRDIPRLIIEHNIHGVDIDPRATQIAGLSLWLRAQRAWAEQGIPAVQRPVVSRSQIVCAEPMPGEKELLREFVEQEFPLGERAVFLPLLESVFDLMQLAGEAGSLLQIEEDIRSAIAEAKLRWKATPRTEQITFFDEETLPTPEQEEMALDLSGITDEEFWEKAEERIYDALRTFAESAGGGYQRRLFAEDAARGFAFIDLCRQRYDVALMNPPFGDASLPSKPYIEETYGDTKGDVYKAFVECFQARLVPAGYLGIISSRTGFFLGQSEDWRTRVVLRLFRPVALADLGMGVLDAMVEVAAYVLRSLSLPEARDLTLSIVPVLEKVVRDRQDRFSLPKWQAARDGLKRHQAVAELEHLETHGFIERSPGDIVRYAPLWHSVKSVTAPPEPIFPPLVCVRALGEPDKEGVIAASINGASNQNVFVCNPVAFSRIPGSTFAYWVGESVLQTFRRLPRIESGPRHALGGIKTLDDTRFLRAWWEVPSIADVHSNWPPMVKGGAKFRFYGPVPLAVDWRNKGSDISWYGYQRRPREGFGAASRGVEAYFRPGVTWSRRTEGLRFRILPAGCIFSDKGPAVVISDDDSQSLLQLAGILNSTVFAGLVGLQLARTELAQSFEVGLIQATPIPDFANTTSNQLGIFAARIWSVMQAQDTTEATSHPFFLPAVFASSGSTLSERATAWATHVRTSEQTIAALQVEIDDLAFSLYNLNDADRAALTPTLANESVSNEEAGEDEEDEVSTADAPALTADLLAYTLGCAFGRWDIRYATGERPAPEPPDPFAPLPVCPPGMLQNPAGLPAAPGDVPASYPVPITWSGILVDDANHPDDIERRLREVLAVIFPDRTDAIVQEACDLLGVKSLREWTAKPAGLFADHLKRYSKSRRQAPIYWPLSTASGSYTLWIYYHRLTPDTLYKCLSDFVEPKIVEVEKEIHRLRTMLAADEAGTRERKQLADAESLLTELREFHADLTHLAPRWKPNLNDGVQITASPLWKLFRLPKWQKTLKETWQKLEKGDYDWAHLALALRPNEVREKCKKDRSLAIAHNLEDLCEIKAPEPKKKAAKKAAKEKGKAKVEENNQPELIEED